MKRRYSLVTLLAMGAAGMMGCRSHMPHAFTWPAGGDIQQTHAKPPEGGYYSNWDPYAVELEVVPMEDVNPVQTQHVLIATVRDAEGNPLPNRRVEWTINAGSVGDIVEVDESGWRASRGYKVTPHYAVSHTNCCEHVIDRGNDDPSDDIVLGPGQTWCVITSPVEGDTHMTVYAPGIYNWDDHKVFVVKHWYDVDWQFPPPATNPIGTQHRFATLVTKYSDGTPLEGYQVTYRIVDGPDAVFDPSGGREASVVTDAQGVGAVTLRQTSPAEGTNNIEIDILRPADIQCCKPAIRIASGMTSKTWVGPQIAITKDAPAQKSVNENFEYTIRVTNPSPVDATNVMVSDTLPDGIAYVSSSPAAQTSGSALTWSLGTLGGGETSQITVTVHGTRIGTFENCAEVTAAYGLSARDCAQTRITAPALVLEKECPAQATTCAPFTYTLIVRNTGDGEATNVRVTDNLPDGITTEDGGRSSMTFNAGTLAAGQAKRAEFRVNAARPGTYTNRATASGDGGLAAEAQCSTTVTEEALAVTKSGPSLRFINRDADYEITVTNTGTAAAQGVSLVDTIPNGTSFVSASDGGQSSGGNVNWNLGTIEPGASKRVTATFRCTGMGTARNTATARTSCAEASDTHEMEIKGIPAILLEVIDLEDPIEVGSNVTYAITVTNQGSAMGTNIRLTCTVPPEQQFISTDGPAAGSLDGKTVTFAPLPSLSPGAKATYRVVCKGTGQGDSRFKVEMISDQISSPVNETESTNIYE